MPNGGRWRRDPRRVWPALAVAVIGMALAGAPVQGGSTGGGAVSLSDEAPATAEDLVTQPAHNSPQLAADPTEPRFVAMASRVDAPAFSCALELSGNGGRSWTRTTPVPLLPRGAERCYAPEVGFDGGGTLHYLFVGLQGAGNTPMGVFLTESADRGRTFSIPRQVLGAGNYQVRMVIDRTLGDRGRIHLVWLRTKADAPTGGLPPPPNPLVGAHSDDGGKSFSTPVQVSDPDRPRAVAPAVALGRDHAVHVLYYDLLADSRDYQGLEGPAWEGAWALVATVSTDAGEHFGRGVVVDNQVAPPERVMLIYTMAPPALAADGQGHVYAAWCDARNGDWDVFARASEDGGGSWAAPRRLNDDPLHDGRHQYLPHLSVAPGGRLDAVFYDRRNDPGNIRNDTYYSYSSDGGRSFAANLRLSSASFDSRIGQRYLVPSAAGLVEFGSRLGSLSTDGGLVAAWTDTRNAFGSDPQTIFTRTVSFGPGSPAPGGGSSLPVVAAIGVLGLATVTGTVWAVTSRRRRNP